MHDLSLIPALCWRYDRHLAQRGRTAGLAHLPADEFTAARPAQPATTAGLRAYLAGVRGARPAQRGTAAAAAPFPDLRCAELGAEPPVAPAQPHAASRAVDKGRVRG